MKRKLRGLLYNACIALLLLCGTGIVRATDGDALVLGVYPYLSPSQIAQQFKPLSEYLAERLKRRVELRSAPDFPKFIERTRAGEYDLIFTAPHMGRLAEKRDGYRPVAQTAYRIVVALVCRKEAPLRDIADLRGRSVAIGARLSMTYQMVEHALGAQGLSLSDGSVTPVITDSFSNVMEATLRGEADVGAMPTALLAKVPAEQKAAVRELMRTEDEPGGLLMAHPRMDAALIERLRQTLLEIGRHPQGRRFLADSQLIDLLPLDAASMQRIDPFTAALEAY